MLGCFQKSCARKAFLLCLHAADSAGDWSCGSLRARVGDLYAEPQNSRGALQSGEKRGRWRRPHLDCVVVGEKRVEEETIAMECPERVKYQSDMQSQCQ